MEVIKDCEGEKRRRYSFFRNATIPKRTADITMSAPKPGDCVWLGVGTIVATVVGISVGDGVGTVVLTAVCVVAWGVTRVGVFVVCVGRVVAFVISGF
jgi:hypothetical protein